MAVSADSSESTLCMTAPNKNAALIREGKLRPELLSPAGSYEALMAAIEGGADAVYMGGVAFNARINAKNFTEDELKRGIALTHSYGTKVYIAANTLIYDRELDGFLRAAEYAYLCGADALIVADMGAAAEIRRRIPIELHASTQVSGHGADTADILARAGFSRMVCAREMSKDDIKRFIDVSPIEAEVFVHGALCVCHSGQCLFSSLVGGRSGNRGECAQPCRLPYKVKKGQREYPLSLKDLSLARHIPELCELGIASLKIEGRMKSPEYVRDVTAIWRRLLDEGKSASASDVKELEAIFSREGFTDKYFYGKTDSSMLGVRTESQKQASKELIPFTKITRKLPVDMRLSIKSDIPVSLTVTRLDNGLSARVEGDIPLVAKTAPIDYSTAKKCMSKLGDTPFTLNNINAEIDGGLILPISSLNALRRSAIQRLVEEIEAPKDAKNIKDKSAPIGKRSRFNTAVFLFPDRIPNSAFEYFDIIYTPLEKYTGSTNGVMLPAIIFDGEKQDIQRMLSDAVAKGAKHVLIGNLGHIELVKHSGLTLHGDFRLNVTNSASAAFIEEQGFEDVVLSPELTLPQIRDIGGRTSACVYGRMPLMITEKCVGKELGDCKRCTSGELTLTDRRGMSFPILRTFRHRSLILNSVPFYMADKQAELERAGISMRHFIFTVETSKKADEIILAYKRELPPKDATKIKRIK